MVSHRQNRLTVYVAASLIAIGLTIASFNTIAAESKKLQQREVPEAVLHAFKSTYPSGRVGAYVREVRDGKTVYELETIEKSVRRDIIYSESGEVLEIEESIPSRMLPATVVSALAKSHPKAKLKKTEKVTRGSEVTYEALFSEEGKLVTLIFRGSGETVAP